MLRLQNGLLRYSSIPRTPEKKLEGTLLLMTKSSIEQNVAEIDRYLSIFVTEVNAERAHGTNNRHQRLGCVAIDDRLELFIILACESTLMNDSDIIIIITYYALIEAAKKNKKLKRK